jgi:iron complex outermembrane receptor protein
MRRFTAMALALVATVVPPLAAQDAKQGADTLATVTITTTAVRYVRPLFETPLSITRLTPEQWRGGSGSGLDLALAAVPGVLAQSRSGGSDIRLVVRGFGARGAGDRSNAGTSRGIRVLLDGIPETEPDGRTSFDAFDLSVVSAIDVIRSNASAIYGNAAGGVVNVSTVPEFDAPYQRAEAQAGSFGLRRYVLAGGSPLGPARLYWTGVQSDLEGWRANSQSTRSLLNMGLVTPLGVATRLGVFLYATHNQFFVPGPLTLAQVNADPAQANATYQARFERRDNRVGRLGVTLDHPLSANQDFSSMFYVQPKLLHRSERGTFRDFTRLHLGGNVVYHARTEFNPAVKGTLSLGVDEASQDGAILFYGLTAQGTRATNLADNKREGASNFGLFASEDLSFGEKFGLSLGARYDDVFYDYASNITPKLNAEKHFTRVTPKIGLNYRLSATRSLFASIGGGIEVPAGNETDPASTFGQDTVTALNPLLDAIRSTTYEVGTRHVIAHGDGVLQELSYDVAGYFTAVSNEIVPYRGGRFYFEAGKVHRTGAEFGAKARAVRGFVLSGALTLSKNRYTQYVVDSVYYGKPGKFADYSGHQMVGLPAVLLNASASWAPAAAGGLRFQVGVQQTGAYYADDANTVRVPSSAVFSAGVLTERVLRLANGLGVRGSVTVQNLTDRKYIGSAFLNPDVVGGVPVAFEPGLPRQLVLTLSVVRSGP